MFGIFNSGGKKLSKKDSKGNIKSDLVITGQINVAYFEDFVEQSLPEDVIGRKAVSLFQLVKANVPVPAFYVINENTYSQFVYNAFNGKLEDVLKKNPTMDPLDIRRLFKRTNFPTPLEEELTRMYVRLSGFSDAWVSVRSSVIYPARPDVNFAGIFDTVLNVRGLDNVLEAIKSVYASVFSDKVVVYAKEHNIDLSKLRMAVVVQKMVQAEVSGVAFTVDPVTLDRNKLGIEAVFGLGDVLANGDITPDQYVLNKKDLSFVEKVVSPQEWMQVSVLNHRKKTASLQRVKISKNWSYTQKLEDSSIQEIAKVALLVESAYKNKPQNIEWVWEGGNIWVLQSKPMSLGNASQENQTTSVQKTTSKSASKQLPTHVESVKGVVEEVRQKVKEISKSAQVEEQEVATKALDEVEDMAKAVEKVAAKVAKTVAKEEKQLAKTSIQTDKLIDKAQKKFGVSDDSQNLHLLGTGLGASAGSVIGEVRVITKYNYHNVVPTAKTILVASEFIPEMESLIVRSGGFILEHGGLTVDAAIIAREIGIPAIVAVKDAMNVIHDGMLLKIDGGSGGIYLITDKKEEIPHRKEAEIVPNKDPESIGKMKQEVAPKLDTTSSVEASIKTNTNTSENKLNTSNIPHTATKVYITDFVQEDAVQYASVVDGVVHVDLDGLMLQTKEHILSAVEKAQFKDYANKIAKEIDRIADIYATAEVIVSIGSESMDSFKKLPNGKKFETSMNPASKGATRYIENPRFATHVCKIIRRVRNVYRDRNVSLAIRYPTNGEIVKELKKIITASGLKRTHTFNLYVYIDRPTDVIVVEDIIKVGIDGLIFNTAAIASEMQGLMLNDKSKLQLTSSGVMKSLETVRTACSTHGVKLIVGTEDDNKLVKKAVEMGVFGVSLSSKDFVTKKKLIADQEAKIILKGRA